MKPCCVSSGINNSAVAEKLEFPDDSFRALPPLVSMDRMVELSREMRAMFPEGVPTEAERLARKVDAEFAL